MGVAATASGVDTDPVVLVTCAGSGIGLAEAETFLADGARVVLADTDGGSAGG